MAVSNYLETCNYKRSKLKNVLYLVSADHVKDIKIDNGEASISGLTELPLRINGFNIQFNEETSLDERYKFQKTITLSMHGYTKYTLFGERYYAILETEDGTLFMVNVDFPSRITHTFNLSKDTNQTDFTFSSLSNFPTLKLNSNFEAVSPVCIGFNVKGVKTLKLIGKDYVKLDTINKTVTTYGYDFSDVEYLGDSCSFQEVYDGTKLTDTITFDIALGDYKPSWQYNLMEFIDNKYSAIITPKGGDNKYYIGFNFGLEPSYQIQAASQNNQSDVITITLTESSNYGTVAAHDYTDEQSTTTVWRYVEEVGNTICYECIGNGLAKYLVQQQTDANGNPTGHYKVREGYTEQYENLGIIDGTFSIDQTFYNASCQSSMCQLSTNVPMLIKFTDTTCYTYSLSADCDWNVSGVVSYLTVIPTSGEAGSEYNISVCNNQSNISGQSSTFTITAGNNTKTVNVLLSNDAWIYPVTQNINCLQQTISFTFDSNCPIEITSNPSNLSYRINTYTLDVSVLKNDTGSARTYTMTVKNTCTNEYKVLTINQDKVYERWQTTSGYLCESGNSYERQMKYTGVTSTDINSPTSEIRKGNMITSGDSRCNQRITKWEFQGEYYCVNGDKYKCEWELESYDSGTTWTKTNNTRLGLFVESGSSFCESSVTYDWSATTKWVCESVDYTKQYLTFIPTESATTFSINLTSGSVADYSLDNGSTWTSIASGVSTPSVAVGQKIMWRGSASGYPGTFASTEKFTAEGNPLSMLYGESFSGQTSFSNTNLTLQRLFANCTGLTSCENLSLPATTLTNNCYDRMFFGCTSLTTAPKLPATTLAIYCYQYMFYNCTSLTTAPKLPATTLAVMCYGFMFYGCSGLTTAPQLPATTLANYCYYGMFTGCSGLTSAPELPATTLADSCYKYMFQGCTSLNYIKCLATDISANSCTTNWVSGVSSSGTFVKSSSMTSWTTGNDGIPSGWTVIEE